jgi:hypothetical protein
MLPSYTIKFKIYIEIQSVIFVLPTNFTPAFLSKVGIRKLKPVLQKINSDNATSGKIKMKLTIADFFFQEPKIFMTDDSAAEKSALRAVWPQSMQFLCHFHLAQAEWRWLISDKERCQ